jgi:Na+-translocating ferredoxin:NAD+ oxidoreductase subunit B
MAAILILSALALVLGSFLGYASLRFKVEENPITDQVNAILPQTQCGQCGYTGCKPYAEAIVNDEEVINKCPPGGNAVVVKLADLLGREATPPAEGEKPPSVAVINETLCIGCTLCIQACPVDAILGAAKHMHTVISQECTGCELCMAPCPVECIHMAVIPTTVNNWIPALATTG